MGKCGEQLKDPVKYGLVQVVLCNDDKMECFSSELHTYFVKLTQVRTKKIEFS